MSRCNKCIVYLLSFGVLSPGVMADTSFGLKGGYQWSLDSSYQNDVPGSLIGGAVVGIELDKSWHFDFGLQRHNQVRAGDTMVDVRSSLIESAVRYSWPETRGVGEYIRLGGVYYDLIKSSGSLVESASGFAPMGEVGVTYRVSPDFRLSAGYQYIGQIGTVSTGRYDSHSVVFGFSYSFPQKDVSETIGENGAGDTHYFVSLKDDGVLFDSSSAELGDQQFLRELREVANILATYAQASVEVVGHSDSTGYEPNNIKLSKQRAQAVADVLIRLGVDRGQIEVIGKGSAVPEASNKTKEGRAINRRVDVRVPDFQIFHKE